MIQFPHNRRARIAFLHDTLMTALSLPLALFLRVGENIGTLSVDYLWQATLIFTVLGMAIFLQRGLYLGVWRYASMNDLVALTKAVTLVVLIFIPIMLLLTRFEAVPRSLPVINWFVLLALLGGPRFVYRLIKDRNRDVQRTRGFSTIPILVVGAGDGAEGFLRAIKRDAATPYRALAILDDRNRRIGQEIHGVRVLGGVQDLHRILETLPEAPRRIVIAKDNPDGAVVRQIMELAESHGIGVARAPRATELHSETDTELGRLAIKPVAVEDLLGRPQQPLDRAAIADMIRGKRVLVTGAGGTIGSELVRQVANQEPEALALVDASEYQLYLIDLEMSESATSLPREAFLGDVRDVTRMTQVIKTFGPDVVFHAAAYKHVPMVEANPSEGVLTNVLGTRVVADACRKAGVSCMVQISSDKAVNPTNIMGATKRIAEAYIQALDPISRAEDSTHFVVVRFGNVLGSTGSVVPLFQRQLAAGGPLTVTHPEVTRYFMTVREAVELVLQAAVAGVRAKEAAGRIFVLDMGQPVRVLDLAQQMIRLAGLRPGTDIEIKFTGLRPGEKLFEELLYGGETLLEEKIPGMTLAAPQVADLAEVSKEIDDMIATAHARQDETVLLHVHKMVPEYRQPDHDKAETA